MPVVLGLSLALNLAVVAAVGGAIWRFREGDAPRGRPLTGQAPLLFALDREDRREIRREMRRVPGARRKDMAQMVSLLRADPFDTDAVERHLQAQRAATLGSQDAASRAWLERIARMSEDERARYATRLEEILARRGRHGKKRAD